MKYLKKFNESHESDILSDINDILLELSDIGCQFRVAKRFENEPQAIKLLGDYTIFISNPSQFKDDGKFQKGKELKYRDIKECVLRLLQYFEIENVKITRWLYDFDSITSSKRVDIKEMVDMDDDIDFNSMLIYFNIS